MLGMKDRLLVREEVDGHDHGTEDGRGRAIVDDPDLDQEIADDHEVDQDVEAVIVTVARDLDHERNQIPRSAKKAGRGDAVDLEDAINHVPDLDQVHDRLHLKIQKVVYTS